MPLDVSLGKKCMLGKFSNTTSAGRTFESWMAGKVQNMQAIYAWDKPTLACHASLKVNSILNQVISSLSKLPQKYLLLESWEPLQIPPVSLVPGTAFVNHKAPYF